MMKTNPVLLLLALLFLAAYPLRAETSVRRHFKVAPHTYGFTYTVDNGEGFFLFVRQGAKPTDTDCTVPFNESALDAIRSMITKAERWSVLVEKEQPPSFTKSLGKLEGVEIVYSWDGRNITLAGGILTMNRTALTALGIALEEAGEMKKEVRDKVRSGKEFADKLN